MFQQNDDNDQSERDDQSGYGGRSLNGRDASQERDEPLSSSEGEQPAPEVNGQRVPDGPRFDEFPTTRPVPPAPTLGGSEIEGTDLTPPTEFDLFEEPEDDSDLAEIRGMLDRGQPGTLGTLGRFEVIRRIGRGGMGQVLLARDSSTSEHVAIKVIDPFHVSNPRVRHAFVKEAKHMHAMSHPHILPVLEIVDDADHLYYVMPYVPGGSLASKAKSGKPVNLDRLLPVAIQVCEALEYAHDKHGVVHRDIKPENVLLSEDGKSAQLCDFGLVRTMFNDTVTTGTPRLGWRIGTRPYMAPEVVEGKAGDYRVDIYSLGAMLYQLVTGRRPYTGGDTEEIFAKIKLGPPPPLKELNPDLPKSWVCVIEGMMHRELNHRYAHMKDVRADLQRIARGERPLGPSQRAKKRSPVVPLVIVGGLVLAAGAAAVTVGTMFPFKLNPVPQNAPPSVSILAPSNDSFDAGEPITFRATATDEEDGDLGKSIRWSSDIDGDLGKGMELETESLSKGIHAITASVEDSDGAAGEAQIRVSVDTSVEPDVAVTERLVKAVEDRDAEAVRVNAAKLRTVWSDPAFPAQLRERLRVAILATAKEGNVEVFRALLENGASFRWADSEGRQPIHIAALNDKADLVTALVELGIDVDEQTDAARETALHIACGQNAYAAIAALAAAGADPNASSVSARTPLHNAAEAGDARAIRALALMNGCDLNVRDVRGQTPLHVAAALGHTETVRALVLAGADRSVRDSRGKSASDLAREAFYDDIADLIEG